jgi:hypothetical protein
MSLNCAFKERAAAGMAGATPGCGIGAGFAAGAASSSQLSIFNLPFDSVL